MTINPAALLPSSKMRPVPASNHAPAAVADLQQPAHVQPLHSVVKVQFIIRTVLVPLVSRLVSHASYHIVTLTALT